MIKGALFVATLAVLPLLGLPHWVLNMLVFVLMFAALASAWNLVGGLTGYPSLGHAAFFGMGAYAFALLLHRQAELTEGWQPFAWLPAIGVGVALIGVPIAAIAMRTRADVFAIVTITLLFVVQTLAFNLHGLTGGAQGLSFPVAPFPADTFERPFYYVLLALLVLAMLLTYGTLHSKIGLALATVRGDEDKARGLGIPVAGAKVLAFAVSVGLTAMVGAVWAYYQVGIIYPQFAVDPLITIAVVLMTFLGGRGTLWGPVLGAVLLEGGQQYLAYELGAGQFYLIAYAMIFLLVMLALPRGILPSLAGRLR
ncbi:branched-chain amino acid ABC transporter permease [Actinoplanes sp. KI2]|uniref:branched-chain amino acid ABC transporter permease n=1 Tax=Actinoplanes sp. KI2 TaxID=2983315 RepID=UPI0021D5A9A3|nr:branched-chain amino acid ABC transporter permease [Actinoplanes sp. KI2]MCU7725187.1 branched-chain amino acid ABC transporter permease [Actinoplanes sp. KI2]